MKIYDVTAPEFAPYGRVVSGYAVDEILGALRDKTPLPDGVQYVPEEPAIQTLTQAQAVGLSLYGGLPVQFGWCNGHNSRLNCLEYHRDSEFNLGTEDYIVLLGRQADIVNGKLDTATVQGFYVPAGVLVEVYATSLHYAPCHADAEKGFKVLIVLPRGSNTEKPVLACNGGDDAMLWARNKWLLAHPDSAEAKAGAWVGLDGENINLDNK